MQVALAAATYTSAEAIMMFTNDHLFRTTRTLVIVVAAAAPAAGFWAFAGCADEAPSPGDERIGIAQSAIGANYCVTPDGSASGCPDGSSMVFSSINQAANQMQYGDILFILDGLYQEDVFFDASAGTGASDADDTFANCPLGGIPGKITICGVASPDGGLPVIQGSGDSVYFKRDHYIFENLQVTSSSTATGAICIRIHADDVTLRNVRVHHCPGTGILATDYNPSQGPGAGSITLDYVEVYAAGSGSDYHPIYIGTDEISHDAGTFRMQHCFIHATREDAKTCDAGVCDACTADIEDGGVCNFFGGNAVKSRAQRNEIYYNWIEGAQHLELDLSGPDWENADGGAYPGDATTPADCTLQHDLDKRVREDSDIVGNVFMHTVGDGHVARLGTDQTGTSCGRYRFVNNTFVYTISEPYINVISPEKLVNSVEAHNNAFYANDGGTFNTLIREDLNKWTDPDAGYLFPTNGAGELLDPDAAAVSGENNAFPSTVGLLPHHWSNTYDALEGAAFRDATLDGGDPRPNTTVFYLRGIGAVNPPSLTGYDFPNPLWPPEYQPPLRKLEKVGTALRWGASASIAPDIGAYPYRAQVVVGWDHACGLLYDGSVKCWGNNASGECGQLFGSTISTPTAVSSLGSNARSISASEGHYSCAVLDDGTVHCWGYNADGQLGDGSTTNSPLPVQASGLSTTAVSVAAGVQHTCAVLRDGSVQCWGYNAFGQLGDGTTTSRSSASTSVSGISSAVAVAVGGYHSCALLADGTVQCWGENGSGELGDGTTTDRHTPVAVTGLSGAVAIAAGLLHSCAALSSGAVKCWGYNGAGQIGDTTTTDRHTYATSSGVTNAVGVTAGQYHTCAVLADGSAKCWGYNGYGQVGNGSFTSPQLTPVAVYGSANMVGVACGGQSTCAILSGGGAQCWGHDNNYQLGNGGTFDQDAPVNVVYYP